MSTLQSKFERNSYEILLKQTRPSTQLPRYSRMLVYYNLRTMDFLNETKFCFLSHLQNIFDLLMLVFVGPR
jgi:hypothetical protein